MRVNQIEDESRAISFGQMFEFEPSSDGNGQRPILNLVQFGGRDTLVDVHPTSAAPGSSWEACRGNGERVTPHPRVIGSPGPEKESFRLPPKAFVSPFDFFDSASVQSQIHP